MQDPGKNYKGLMEELQKVAKIKGMRYGQYCALKLAEVIGFKPKEG